MFPPKREENRDHQNQGEIKNGQHYNYLSHSPALKFLKKIETNEYSYDAL